MTDWSFEWQEQHGFRVHLAAGALAHLGARVADLLPPPRTVLLVSDEHVAGHHGAAATAALKGAGYRVHAHHLPAGEDAKSVTELARLWDRGLQLGLERRDLVVALGGGVVGDLAGFAASTLLRGLALVQVPTSLLAMVDAAIGGKTAINHGPGKNLVGTFWQPRLTLVDPGLLATLPERELRAGLGEVVKAGMIDRPGILERLEQGPGRPAGTDLVELVRECVVSKCEVVAEDAREGGRRAHLNFGHTLGHALEAVQDYRGLRHGEAVAVGMVGATLLGVELGVTAPELLPRLRQLLTHLGLPERADEPVDAVLARIGADKKRSSGRTRWVLVQEPGRVLVRDDVPEERVRLMLEQVLGGPPAA